MFPAIVTMMLRLLSAFAVRNGIVLINARSINCAQRHNRSEFIKTVAPTLFHDPMKSLTTR